MQPAILVVAGASGAGKTTLVNLVDAMGIAGVGCYGFDSIRIPSEEEIAVRFGDGLGFQDWALHQWMGRLTRNDDGVAVAVLDAQLRPSAVIESFRLHDVVRGEVVLVDCAHDVRNARLHGPRGQPELATPRMDQWAAYLRGQADALRLDIIDTTDASPDAAARMLASQVERLLSAG